MKTSVENLKGHHKKLTVEIPKELVTQSINDYLEKVRKNAEINGFRKGKAPLYIIKEKYKDSVMSDVTREIVENNLRAALLEEKLNPAHMPKIESPVLLEGMDFSFSALFENIPPVKLTKYTDVKLTKLEAAVSDEALNKTLENLQNNFAKYLDLPEDEACKVGHFVTFDCEASSAGAPIEAVTKSAVSLELGKDLYDTRISDSLVGMKKGSAKNVQIKYPDKADDKSPFHPELTGKTVDYTLTLSNLRKKEIDPLDDSFAKKLGLESFDKLKEIVTEDMKKQIENSHRQQYREQVAEYLLKNNPVESPETMINEQIQQLIWDAGMQLSRMGLDQESAQKKLKEDEDHFKERATMQVKTSLLLSEIAKTEKIQASQDDVRKEIVNIAHQSGKKPEEVAKDLNEKGMISGLYQQIGETKALDWLVDKALSET